MINPLEDDSRWTVMSSRFEMPEFITDAYKQMFREWFASLPEDSPARALAQHLPMAPGWELDTTE